MRSLEAGRAAAAFAVAWQLTAVVDYMSADQGAGVLVPTDPLPAASAVLGGGELFAASSGWAELACVS